MTATLQVPSGFRHTSTLGPVALPELEARNSERSGAPILPLMAGAVLLAVCALAVLSQVATYWMVGAAVALTVAEIAGGVTWILWLMADDPQNPGAPQQEAVNRVSSSSRLVGSLIDAARQPNPA